MSDDDKTPAPDTQTATPEAETDTGAETGAGKTDADADAGNKTDGGTAKSKPSTRKATKASTAKPKPEPKSKGFVVSCFQPGGRRRAGQHWDEGKTTVAASKMTDELLAALKADPLFSVTEA